MEQWIQIHPKDNVAVALTELPAGTLIPLADRMLQVCETIPEGHKLALQDLEAGELIVKYGYPIGRLIRAVKAGSWVNEQVLKTALDGLQDYA